MSTGAFVCSYSCTGSTKFWRRAFWCIGYLMLCFWSIRFSFHEGFTFFCRSNIKLLQYFNLIYRIYICIFKYILEKGCQTHVIGQFSYDQILMCLLMCTYIVKYRHIYVYVDIQQELTSINWHDNLVIRSVHNSPWWFLVLYLFFILECLHLYRVWGWTERNSTP